MRWYLPTHPSWLALPFLQTQNVVAAALLGALAWLLAARRRARWLVLPLFLLPAAYLLADQVYFKIFLDHIRATPTETGHGLNLHILLPTLFQSWDRACTLSAAVALAGAALLAARLRTPAAWRYDRLAILAAALLAVAGIPAVFSARYFGLNQHPLWVAARDRTRPDLAAVLTRHPLASAALPSLAQPSATLPDLLSASHAVAAPRNLVLIVLESVGAHNLLNAAGAPDPAVTPTLASLAANGILFDTLYAPTPGTTASWLSLHTGGLALPLGGEKELRAPYRGPSLPRVFRNLGYRTAYFSSQPLAGDFSDVVLSQMGFDHLYDFGLDLASRDPRNHVHTWSAREDYTLAQVEPWIDEASRSGRPFLLEYATGTTHYPYGVPPGAPAPFQTGYPLNDYRNALHYTDQAIADLLSFLDRRGLRRNTVVAITGDHGEAFGDLHAENRGHRDHLFEENVRTFFLLSDPSVPSGPRVSHRIASNGAILPTLAAWADPRGLHEPNLFDADFPTRPVHFYKVLSPEQCGLRDGQWKYIGALRSPQGELYDLSADPAEVYDVARLHPQRAAAYRADCAAWMVSATRDFTSRLEGYTPAGPRDLQPADLAAPGPKMAAMGRVDRETFTPADRFSPSDSPVVWTRWVDAVDSPDVRYDWIAPGGRVFSAAHSSFLTFDEAFAPCPAPRPLAPGAWKVQVWIQGRAVLNTAFAVAPNR